MKGYKGNKYTLLDFYKGNSTIIEMRISIARTWIKPLLWGHTLVHEKNEARKQQANNQYDWNRYLDLI